MEVIVVPTGPIEANCYILVDESTKKALIVDPGDDGDIISALLGNLGLVPEGILLTHAHFDHIGAVDEIAKRFGCKVYLNPAEIPFLKESQDAYSGYSAIQNIKIDSEILPLTQGKQKIGDFEVEAIFAPGHSIGSTMFLIDDKLFSGDVLFQGSIGRTDLPTGDMSVMEKTLRQIKEIEANYPVYPGHGPATTLSWEKSHNPFLLSL